MKRERGEKRLIFKLRGQILPPLTGLGGRTRETHGLRRGLPSFAAPRLGDNSCERNIWERVAARPCLQRTMSGLTGQTIRADKLVEV
jgi:hypothetical protein